MNGLITKHHRVTSMKTVQITATRISEVSPKANSGFAYYGDFMWFLFSLWVNPLWIIFQFFLVPGQSRTCYLACYFAGLPGQHHPWLFKCHWPSKLAFQTSLWISGSPFFPEILVSHCGILWQGPAGPRGCSKLGNPRRCCSSPISFAFLKQYSDAPNVWPAEQGKEQNGLSPRRRNG